MEEEIKWIPNTPLGLNIREIKHVPPHYHNDILEIIMCLSGQVTVSYCFEEFTLFPGEYILVDKDAHFLYDGKNAVCVSFYFDLLYFKKKYRYINYLSYVCEGTRQSIKPFNTTNHKHLKAMLLALLICLINCNEITEDIELTINEASSKIVQLLMDKFDIIFWYHPNLEINISSLKKYRELVCYLARHHDKKVDLESLSEETGLSKIYISEFLSTVSIGFQRTLHYCRASHAAQLLITTNINILEISEECGFSDPKYFYKAFRFWYLCTPGQFREKYSNSNKHFGQEVQLSLGDISYYITDIVMKHFLEWFIK